MSELLGVFCVGAAVGGALGLLAWSKKAHELDLANSELSAAAWDAANSSAELNAALVEAQGARRDAHRLADELGKAERRLKDAEGMVSQSVDALSRAEAIMQKVAGV